MTVIKGADARIAIGDGENPTESFTELKGTQTIGLNIKRHMIAKRDLGQAPYSSYEGGQGSTQVEIHLKGLYDQSAVSSRLADAALSGDPLSAKLTLESGQTYYGSFVVYTYRRDAAHDDVQAVEVDLISSGVFGS